MKTDNPSSRLIPTILSKEGKEILITERDKAHLKNQSMRFVRDIAHVDVNCRLIGTHNSYDPIKWAVKFTRCFPDGSSVDAVRAIYCPERDLFSDRVYSLKELIEILAKEYEVSEEEVYITDYSPSV